MVDTARRLTSRSGLSLEVTSRGALRRFDCGSTALNLFVGNELEGGPANLYLRRHRSGTTESFRCSGRAARRASICAQADGRLIGAGNWQGVDYVIALVLAQDAPAWFWHVRLLNTTPSQTAARPHLRAGHRARALRDRAAQRVLRQPVRRSHAARASVARLRDRIAAEPAGDGPPSVVRDRLAAQRDVVRDRRAAVHGLRRARALHRARQACRAGACSTSIRWSRSRTRRCTSRRARASARASSAGSRAIIRARASPADLERVDEATRAARSQCKETIGFVPADVTDDCNAVRVAPTVATRGPR